MRPLFLQPARTTILRKSIVCAKPNHLRSQSILAHGSEEFDSQIDPNGIRGHLYFSKATAEGKGRDDVVRTPGCDFPLELRLTHPKSIGGRGNGPNPEQMFAMGYASCFLNSLQKAATKLDKKQLGDKAKVHVSVYLGQPADSDVQGHTLKTMIDVEGLDDDEIICNAHEHCAFSRALRGAEVVVKKI